MPVISIPSAEALVPVMFKMALAPDWMIEPVLVRFTPVPVPVPVPLLLPVRLTVPLPD